MCTRSGQVSGSELIDLSQASFLLNEVWDSDNVDVWAFVFSTYLSNYGFDDVAA